MAADDALIGKKLGDYTIVSLLGRGGMSRVYKGYDANLDRYAAVKVISGDFATTTEEEYTRRFQTEARAIAHLRQENIVGVYQFGRTEGTYYMAQVFLEGKDLRGLLKEYADRGRRIPKEEILRIVRDITRALDYAHEQGVIHRDIKPSNIMLEKKTGRAILMDFGLALAVHEGTAGDTFGSAHYIAPEQAISSAKAVSQSDLYSLGIVIYEMVAGKVPFDDPSVMSVALKHLNELPPPPTMYNPDMAPEVENVILKVLDKDPARRYPTGKALFNALEYAFEEDSTPDVGPQISVTDMLATQPKPPEGLTPVAPVADTASRPTPAEETGAPRGLAGRFRRSQQEKEAIVAAETGEGLQIDDDSLSKLIDAYADPADIGLVGDGAAGITPPPRRYGLSAQTQAPATTNAPKEQKKRRSRTGLLLTLLLIIVIAVGAVYLGTQGGDGDGGGDEGGGTALAAADLTATAENAAGAVVASDTPAATATERAAATDDDTAEGTPAATSGSSQSASTPTATLPATATRVPSRTPEVTGTAAASATPDEQSNVTLATATVQPEVTSTTTVAPTDTVAPSATLSATATPQSAATATDRPEPTSTVTPAATEGTAGAPTPNNAVVTLEPNIRLRYEEEAPGQGSLLLINLTGRTLDVSDLVFEHQRRDGVVLRYEAALWDRQGITANPARTPARSCFQLVTTDGTASTDGGVDCARFLGFYRTNVSSRYFWISGEGGATFTVRYADSDTILAECVIADELCDFYAGPDADSVVAPTPIAPDEGLTVLLHYDSTGFLLVNTSEQALDVSALIFEQVSGAGLRRFSADQWNRQGALDPPTAMRSGGCFQLVPADTVQVTPTRTLCPSLLGWFRTSVTSRYFWISPDEGMTFDVYLGDSIMPLATCEIDAGECEITLPPPTE